MDPIQAEVAMLQDRVIALERQVSELNGSLLAVASTMLSVGEMLRVASGLAFQSPRVGAAPTDQSASAGFRAGGGFDGTGYPPRSTAGRKSESEVG